MCWKEKVWDESVVADERGLDGYRRSVVGYVAVKLGGEGKAPLILVQPWTTAISFARGREWWSLMLSRVKNNIFFFYLSLFFKRMCLDFSPVPYKKKNTRNDWQINDFTCLSELILALRSRNVLKNNWRLSKNKGQLALIVDEINDFSISLK